MNTEALQRTTVDPNRPDIQEKANKLAQMLVQRYGPGDSIAVALILTEELMSGVLHLESPMPEANIDMITRLLKTLTSNVLQHGRCARLLNDTKTVNGVAH